MVLDVNTSKSHLDVNTSKSHQISQIQKKKRWKRNEAIKSKNKIFAGDKRKKVSNCVISMRELKEPRRCNDVLPLNAPHKVNVPTLGVDCSILAAAAPRQSACSVHYYNSRRSHTVIIRHH